MAATAAPSPPPAQHAFAPYDWALVAAVAATWGSSFLLIEIGIDHFSPEVVAALRLAFGALTLAVIPGARRAVRREDLPAIALLGVLWMAVPFLLFPHAQEDIDSSLAGMINAASPLFTALIAIAITRTAPSRRTATGLLVGFAGVVAIGAPELDGASAGALGVGLVLLATVLYGFSFNLTGPLQQRNGALPVIWRAQLFALVLDVPAAAVTVGDSEFAWSSLLACAGLGAAGTALAYVWFSVLVGRVGASRGAVTLYLVPVVAIVLGATLRDETITLAGLAGTALVLAGAYVVGGGRR
jgi:drug/metabolite transporter (DMT)-like permease